MRTQVGAFEPNEEDPEEPEEPAAWLAAGFRAEEAEAWRRGRFTIRTARA